MPFARGIKLGLQRDPIAAGHNLERHDHCVAGGIPFKADLASIDRDARERVIHINDKTLLDDNAAVDHIGNAVGPYVGAKMRA